MDKFMISYDDENDVIYIQILDLLDAEDLTKLIPQYEKLIEGKPRRYALVDMTESAKFDASAMTKEMRNSYKELIDVMDTEKTAVFGASPALRMTAKIALAVTGKSGTTHFCKTKDEALLWLKGEGK